MAKLDPYMTLHISWPDAVVVPTANKGSMTTSSPHAFEQILITCNNCYQGRKNTVAANTAASASVVGLYLWI